MQPHSLSNVASIRHFASCSQRRATLAACMATTLGIGSASMPALANTVYPLACGDPAVPIFPTLRSAIASALDGDTVDLSRLNCATPSLITLAQGEINILKNNLTIYAPPGSPFTIDAAGQSRIFEHKGTGVLALKNLRLTNGVAQNTSYSGYGGCVGSNGSLELTYTNVTGCSGSAGGGLYSKGHTKLVHSMVSGNTARADGGGILGLAGFGGGGILAGAYLSVKYGSSISNNHSNSAIGGAFSGGNITTKLSVISGNSDNNNAGSYCGTALSTRNSLTMTSTSVEENYGQQPSDTICASIIQLNDTTISGNRSNPFGTFAVGGGSVTLTNSTISGNTGGGVRTSLASVSGGARVFNSTIAFNGGTGIYGDTQLYGPPCMFEVQSSIVANNFSYFTVGDQTGADVYLKRCANYDSSGIIVDHDVIIHSNFAFPNATAMVTRDPHLSPLALRGGPVKTHALSANSSAVDAGNNLTGQANDARGSGFVRVVGAAADIGAYERQANDDEIFYGGFQ